MSKEIIVKLNKDHEPLYKYSDIKKIIKGLPTKKIAARPSRRKGADDE